VPPNNVLVPSLARVMAGPPISDTTVIYEAVAGAADPDEVSVTETDPVVGEAVDDLLVGIVVNETTRESKLPKLWGAAFTTMPPMEIMNRKKRWDLAYMISKRDVKGSLVKVKYNFENGGLARARE
jgi:hypothetical protein